MAIFYISGTKSKNNGGSYISQNTTINSNLNSLSSQQNQLIPKDTQYLEQPTNNIYYSKNNKIVYDRNESSVSSQLSDQDKTLSRLSYSQDSLFGINYANINRQHDVYYSLFHNIYHYTREQ